MIKSTNLGVDRLPVPGLLQIMIQVYDFYTKLYNKIHPSSSFRLGVIMFTLTHIDRETDIIKTILNQ